MHVACRRRSPPSCAPYRRHDADSLHWALQKAADRTMKAESVYRESRHEDMWCWYGASNLACFAKGYRAYPPRYKSSSTADTRGASSRHQPLRRRQLRSIAGPPRARVYEAGRRAATPGLGRFPRQLSRQRAQRPSNARHEASQLAFCFAGSWITDDGCFTASKLHATKRHVWISPLVTTPAQLNCDLGSSCRDIAQRKSSGDFFAGGSYMVTEVGTRV